MYRVVTDNKSTSIIIAKASMIAEANDYDLKFYIKQLSGMTVIYTIK